MHTPVQKIHADLISRCGVMVLTSDRLQVCACVSVCVYRSAAGAPDPSVRVVPSVSTLPGPVDGCGCRLVVVSLVAPVVVPTGAVVWCRWWRCWTAAFRTLVPSLGSSGEDNDRTLGKLPFLSKSVGLLPSLGCVIGAKASKSD